MRRPTERRRQNRHALPRTAEARVEFEYPAPGGWPCVMPLRDVSAAGLSIVLTHELPGLEVGSRLDGATVRIGTHAFLADLVMMHVTPGPSKGAVCGALIYPAEDCDLLTLRKAIAELEGRPATAPAAARLGSRRF
jgi:hypothetical protein